MSRYKKYEPKQHMILPIDPDKMYPIDTFERFLVDTIEKLDLADFNKNEDDKGGESRYDPRSLLGMIFYGFSKGTFSSRKLSNACQSDLGFMFVSGYAEPEHSTICRFVQQYKEELKKIFTQILYIADNSGFLDYSMIALDGTKIKGNASKQFCGTLKDFEKRKNKLEKNIEKAMKKQQEADSEDEVTYWHKKQERYKKAHTRIESFLKEAEVKQNNDGTERQQSITDNDSQIVKDKTRYICGYNAQAAVDVKSGIIVTADIVDNPTDKRAFSQVIEELKQTVPAESLEQVYESSFLADNGYFSGSTMDYSRKNDLDIYIADGTSETLYSDPDGDNNKVRKVSVRECTIKKDKDGNITLTCPGGITTDNCKLRKEYRGKNVYRIRIGANLPECNKCSRYEGCVGKNKKRSKDFEVDQQIVDNHQFVSDHHEKLHSKTGKRIYAKRMSAIEHVFGDIKHNKNFTGFLRRGMGNVKTEWQLIMMTFNLMKIYKLQRT